MIQVMGEALIDIIVSPEGEIDSVVGGGPVNTARTIARLGIQASFIGGISQDALGKRVRRLLDSDGVNCAVETACPEPTTLAIATLDESGAAAYQFLMNGTSSLSITPDVALKALDHRAMAVHIGTLALVFRPLSQATRAVISALSTHQLLMVDPNARPSVMNDPTEFWETFNASLVRADVIKVSGDDLDYMFPELSNHEAAVEIQKKSQAVVLFTDGSQGVHVFTELEDFSCDVPSVDVVDTVGAGDSFSGGFLSHWDSRGWTRADIQDCAKVRSAVNFGIKVAGITCQRAGAMPPFANELE
ncbi:MAG: carbohydrate kinase [Actinomycetia bacterium]|jgi:fructokinase|nr:carbohydrate kinase [Actinomycetes bacterium]MCH9830408.1 carbohydrate kinase [Actinomycetes bacterium]MCH9840588.1 carbohydrate kinase [Actinomycetes bacterium]